MLPGLSCSGDDEGLSVRVRWLHAGSWSRICRAEEAAPPVAAEETATPTETTEADAVAPAGEEAPAADAAVAMDEAKAAEEGKPLKAKLEKVLMNPPCLLSRSSGKNSPLPRVWKSRRTKPS